MNISASHGASVTGCNLIPTMHPDYPIGARVSAKLFQESNIEIIGTIIGVASTHVIFHYIILMDSPVPFAGYDGWKAFSIPGTLFKLL